VGETDGALDGVNVGGLVVGDALGILDTVGDVVGALVVGAADGVSVVYWM